MGVVVPSMSRRMTRICGSSVRGTPVTWPPNAAVSAEIEPMKRAARNTNQVASFHLNRDNRALLRMDVEQPTPGHNVTDFVLIVRMLYVELGEHSFQPGSIRIDVDHVRGDIAAFALELFDLPAVGAQDLLRGSIRREVRRRFPAFVVNANPGEVIAHFAVFAERTVLIGDSKDSHGNQLQLRPARKSRAPRGV